MIDFINVCTMYTATVLHMLGRGTGTGMHTVQHLLYWYRNSKQTAHPVQRKMFDIYGSFIFLYKTQIIVIITVYYGLNIPLYANYSVSHVSITPQPREITVHFIPPFRMKTYIVSKYTSFALRCVYQNPCTSAIKRTISVPRNISALV